MRSSHSPVVASSAARAPRHSTGRWKGFSSARGPPAVSAPRARAHRASHPPYARPSLHMLASTFLLTVRRSDGLHVAAVLLDVFTHEGVVSRPAPRLFFSVGLRPRTAFGPVAFLEQARVLASWPRACIQSVSDLCMMQCHVSPQRRTV